MSRRILFDGRADGPQPPEVFDLPVIAQQGQIPVPEPNLQPFIDTTLNQVLRLSAILCFGFWGGWSFLPNEERIPKTKTWVFFVCLCTNWVVFTILVDSMRPSALKWYFRTPRCYLFIATREKAIFELTGYVILVVTSTLGYALFKWIKRDEQYTAAAGDLTDAFLGILGLFLVGRLEGRGVARWFFNIDYWPQLRLVLKLAYFPSSWWWIALRITAIVKILRNRHVDDMRGQLVILLIGLGVEATLLLTILWALILYRFKRNIPWDDGIWYHHKTVYAALVACWVLVVLCGFVEMLPNLFFPCSGSTSDICTILTSSFR